MQRFLKKTRQFGVIAVIVAGLAMVSPLAAQLDYDTYDIYQGGNLVGTIYVPARGPDTTIYAEYWILSNRYVYPSEKNPVATGILPTKGYHYISLTDFLTKAPWGDGYHYVTVTAFDRTSKPVPVATAAE